MIKIFCSKDGKIGEVKFTDDTVEDIFLTFAKKLGVAAPVPTKLKKTNTSLMDTNDKLASTMGNSTLQRNLKGVNKNLM